MRDGAWGGRNAPRAIFLYHHGDATHQIAEVVREVGVVAFLETLPGKVAVLPEGDLFHEIEP